jgi:hypothetical protein
MTDPKPVPPVPSRWDAFSGQGERTDASGAQADPAQSHDHSSTASTVAPDRERSRMESHSLKNEATVRSEGDIHAAVRTVLDGFARGVFVRSTENDADPAWAIKVFPYLRALAIIQEAYSEPEL